MVFSVTISDFILITLTLSDVLKDFTEKSFSENLESFRVLVIHLGVLGFDITGKILPFDTTIFPPNITALIFIFLRLSKIRRSAIFPGAMPPNCCPRL